MTALRALVLLAALVASGCAEPSFARLHFLSSAESAENPATYLHMPLRTGQVVLSEAPGPYSLLFSLGPERPYDFTHAAILVMEEGKPFVYEMTGEYKPSFGRPTDSIEGGPKRMPLADYCMAYLYVEIFDPPHGVDGEKVGAWCKARFEDETEFDAYFDYSEHEKLFCTEFVALALEAGGAPPVELVSVRPHPSLEKLLVWLGVGRERCLPAGLLADPERSAAALGQMPTLAAAASYFAAKAELHRRFTPDQLLGNVFDMTGLADIAIRPSVYEFLVRATGLFRGHRKKPAPETITAAVQDLADEMFGVAPDENVENAR